MTTGRRFQIWPLVTIPVHGEPTEVRLDGRYGLKWLRSLAQDPAGISVEQQTAIRNAIEDFSRLDPNSFNHAPLIAPLANLGFLMDEDMHRIIESADISYDVEKKDVVRKNAPDGPDTIPVERRSPGLDVLDELMESVDLYPEERERIAVRKADFFERQQRDGGIPIALD